MQDEQQTTPKKGKHAAAKELSIKLGYGDFRGWMSDVMYGTLESVGFRWNPERDEWVHLLEGKWPLKDTD